METRPLNSKSGRLRPYRYSELAALPAREPLIKGLLGKGELSEIHGPPGSAKTFLALDISLHVALGMNWRGLRTHHGGCVYLSLEGGVGIRNRIAAFKKHHGIEIGNAPLWVMPEHADLCDERGDTDELIREIQRIEGDVDLIVVDTLARALSGGNENSAEDMGALIKNLDRLRAETGAHAMLIHHSGKDATKGARGSTALLGAVDTALEIKATSGTRTASVVKQRDGISGQGYSFTLKPVALGYDDDGDELTSCICEPTDKGATLDSLSGFNQIAHDAFMSLIDVTERDMSRCPVEHWRDEFNRRCPDGRDIKRDTLKHRFNRAAMELQRRGFLNIRDDTAWLKTHSGTRGT